MSKKFAANIDLLLNELQNAKIHIVASDPASPVEGQIYYNSTTKALKFYNGSAWVQIGYLNQMTATGAVSVNGQLISSVATPISGTDAANKDYVDSVAQGLDAKPSVEAISLTNITISAPGATIDGVTPAGVGSRFILNGQTAPAENGIWLWNGAAVAMTRALDCNTWNELVGAFAFVEKGTSPETGWLCSVDAGGTLGTTAVTWVQFSAAGQITAANLAGAGSRTNAQVWATKTGQTLNFRTISVDTASPILLTQNTNDIRVGFDPTIAHDTNKVAKYYKGTFTFVSSGADITLTHNLALPAGTFNQLTIDVYETASPYNSIEVDASTTAWTANAAYIKMTGTGLSTTAGAYTAVIQG